MTIQTQRDRKSTLDRRKALGNVLLRLWAGYAPTSDSAMNVDLTGFIKTYFDENDIRDRYGRVLRVGKAIQELDVELSHG
jgi:hypothetical protein